jgi:RNA polymerase sigma factor (sigma-70 family)
LKNADDALDVVQDTFISVFQNISKLNSDEAYKSWMCQIAINKCKKLLGKNSLPLLEDDDLAQLNEIEDPDEEIIPENALDNKASRDIIMELIDSLPESQRTAIMLKYYEDLSVEDVARVTDSSVSAVKSRLMYARNKIKDGIEEYKKKGVKLYSMAALPLIALLLKEVAKEHTISTDTAASILEKSFQGAGISSPIAVDSPNQLKGKNTTIKNIFERKINNTRANVNPQKIKNLLKTTKGKIIVCGSCAGVVAVAATITVCAMHMPKTASAAVTSSNILTASTSSVTTFSTSSSTTSSRTISSSKAITPTVSVAPQSNVAVTSVDFSSRSQTLKVGSYVQLDAAITPSNASNKTLTWTSTNSSVASVNSNGVVRANGTGTAYIRATNPNGQRDTCTVTVVSSSTPVRPSSGSGSNSTGGSRPANTKISGTVSGCPAVINPALHYISITVNTSDLIDQYAGQPLNLKVYKDGSLYLSAQDGVIFSNVDTSSMLLNLATYWDDDNTLWIKPASYKVNCYAGNYLFKTLQFSVNENGLC